MLPISLSHSLFFCPHWWNGTYESSESLFSDKLLWSRLLFLVSL
jgi:hypothetical protein